MGQGKGKKEKQAMSMHRTLGRTLIVSHSTVPVVMGDSKAPDLTGDIARLGWTIFSWPARCDADLRRLVVSQYNVSMSYFIDDR